MSMSFPRTRTFRLALLGLREELDHMPWRRRRRFLVEPELQHRLLRQNFFLVMIGAIMAVATVYVAYAIGAVYGFDAKVLAQNGWPEFALIGFYALTSLMVSGTVFVLASYFYSHRIAGPAGKLRQTLNRMAAGEPVNPIKLRRTDHLKGLSNAVNHLGYEWQRSLDDLRQVVHASRADVDSGDAKAVHGRLDEVEAILDRHRVFTAWRL